MKIEKDGQGNAFVRVGNVRLTYVTAEKRAAKKNWAGQSVLRVTAYRNDKNDLQHRGAEFPIGTESEALAFVEAFCALVRVGAQM